MSSPTGDEDEVPEDVKAGFEERAEDVLEGGEFVSFEEHSEQRG